MVILQGLCVLLCFFFFFNDTATTEIYTLSLHDALPSCTSPTPTANSTSAFGATSPPRWKGRRRSAGTRTLGTPPEQTPGGHDWGLPRWHGGRTTATCASWTAGP